MRKERTLVVTTIIACVMVSLIAVFTAVDIYSMTSVYGLSEDGVASVIVGDILLAIIGIASGVTWLSILLDIKGKD